MADSLASGCRGRAQASVEAATGTKAPREGLGPAPCLLCSPDDAPLGFSRRPSKDRCEGLSKSGKDVNAVVDAAKQGTQNIVSNTAHDGKARLRAPRLTRSLWLRRGTLACAPSRGCGGSVWRFSRPGKLCANLERFPDAVPWASCLTDVWLVTWSWQACGPTGGEVGRLSEEPVSCLKDASL